MSPRHIPPTLRESFWRKVEKTDTCWLWTGSKTKKGYGVQALPVFPENWAKRPGIVRAHKFAWEEENGPVPKGMGLLHTCNVKHCVRPSHMKLGFSWDAARKNGKEPNCRACGQKKTPDNVYISKTGSRRCKACHNARVREYNQRQLAKRRAARAVAQTTSKEK